MNCEQIRALLAEGDTCVETDRGVRILTHCLHPSFEQVAVYVTRQGDGFIVHDGGEAVRVVLRHGRDEHALQSALKRASVRFGLTIEEGVIVARVPQSEWFRSAILSVANASALASSLAVEAVAAKQERQLHEQIRGELLKAVPERRIAYGYQYRGVSGREWQMDFAVLSDRGPLLIKAISPHPNSISASYTAFGDIGANDNVPRFAVHSLPLSAENAALIRQVAWVTPLTAVQAGVLHAMGASSGNSFA